MDTWQMIRQERAALVAALAELPDVEWDNPTWCAGWSVRELVGHLISTATLTPLSFFGKLVGGGFDFKRMTGKEIDRHTRNASPSELLDRLAARTESRTAPPGPAPSWLGETIVHGEDIFRPRGAYLPHAVENVVAVGRFYSGSNLLIGSKSRIDGVTLRATDADWTHGSGPEVVGPAIALVMAMTGRKGALEDLSGDGVAVLRKRD